MADESYSSGAKQLNNLGRKAIKRVAGRKRRARRRRALINKIVVWTLPVICLTLNVGFISAMVAFSPDLARMLE